MLELNLEINTDTDLFAFWQYELNMRQEFRKTFFGKQPIITNIEQVEFLYRSLYLPGKTTDFFIALFPNLDKTPTLNWLKTSPSKIKAAFLSFLPNYINNYKPPIEQLLFLVPLYHPELNYLFISIFNHLTSPQCQYLINKTANRDLRNLLKKRINFIENEQKQLFYGNDFTKSQLTYPTMQGDKLEILIKTIYLIHELEDHKDYWSYYKLASALFDLGLIEDCLYILIKMKHLMERLDPVASNSWRKLLFKTIPLCALISSVPPYKYAKNIYNHYFPDLISDDAGLLYLKLYERLQVTTSSFTGTLLDLYPEVLRIQQLRGEEIPLLLAKEISTSLSASRFIQVTQLASDKLASMPHEAFVILELLRKMLQHDMLARQVNKDLIAKLYLDLFNWLPSSRFMHETMIAEILPHTSPAIREDLEKVLRLMIYYKNNSLSTEFREKPDLFKLKNEDLRRTFLIGEFMGVLK